MAQAYQSWRVMPLTIVEGRVQKVEQGVEPNKDHSDSQYQAFLADEAATLAFGERVAASLELGTVVYLEGDLGRGKTTLSRGIIRGCGHSGAVKSPTYTLVEPYQIGSTTLYHFDLYRLGDPEELEYMGIRDYFTGNSIVLVEWPSQGVGVIPEPDVVVRLCVEGEGRRIDIVPHSARGKHLLQGLR